MSNTLHSTSTKFNKKDICFYKTQDDAGNKIYATTFIHCNILILIYSDEQQQIWLIAKLTHWKWNQVKQKSQNIDCFYVNYIMAHPAIHSQ